LADERISAAQEVAEHEKHEFLSKVGARAGAAGEKVRVLRGDLEGRARYE